MGGKRCSGQQLQQRTCFVVKPDVASVDNLYKAAAEASVCGSSARDSQQFALVAGFGAAEFSSMTRRDGVTSAGTGLNTVTTASAAGWSSWLVAADVREKPVAAKATQADPTRQALAWVSPNQQQQQRIHDRAAMLVTTSG